MTGAARLIALAAGRVGTGLITVAAPEGAMPQIQAGLTEPTFLPLPETAEGTVAAEAIEPLLARLEAADALAIGPGLTTNDQTVAFVRETVRRSPVPLVLDADGLNAFTGDGGALQDRQADTVLTPHVGEFARLTGVKPRDLDADRPAHVRALAEQTGAVTLLKGSRTVIAQPGGRLLVNVTGSPALATAGTGDVLTGMIGGLLARGVAPLESAAAATYLHGLAGVFAGRDLGEGALAGDVLERIPEALGQVAGE
jgi:NAD(P)H-hydrate epimerase